MLHLHDQLKIIEKHRRSGRDVRALAEKLGVKVEISETFSEDERATVQVEPTTKGGFGIALSAELSAHAQREILAHLLAHIVLHPYLLGDRHVVGATCRVPARLPEAVEGQAERLAAEMLAPCTRPATKAEPRSWLRVLLDRFRGQPAA